MKNKLWVYFLIFLILFCAFFFHYAYDDAKKTAIIALNEKQISYARQASVGIDDFFKQWTNVLTSITRMPAIVNLDETGKKFISLTYETNKDDITAISRVDANGKIIFTVPLDPKAIGQDISGQKHIQEVMRSHKPIVSDVFKSVQGFDMVALHVPVLKNGKYQGSVGIGINFQTLSKRYLERIKFGKTGYAWMISRDGKELYCPVPGHTGNSVFENCKDYPDIIAMAEEMIKEKQGVTTYTFDQIRERKVERVKKHAAYMPVHIGQTFWSIVVASSENEILSSLENFRNKLILIVVLFLVGSAIFSFFGLRGWFIVHEEQKRKRTEVALRESEEKYRLVVNNIADVITVLDLNLRFTYVSPSVIRLRGYTAEEVMSQTMEQMLTPESLQIVARTFEEELKLEAGGTIDPGRSRILELEEYRKDGSTVWLENRMSALRDKEKKLIGIITLSHDITDRKRVEEELQRTLESLRKSVSATIQVMVSAVETRDPYTAGHQIRSADLARAIATEMGLPQDKIDGIRMAGSIHDIGKLSIPAEILSKPTKLSELEFSLIKEHARKGFEMLKDVESPWPLAEIVHQHHERMDGSGYPRKCKGEEILIEARILAVADVVESMASHRPYRPALGIDEALAEIEKNKGILYDADAVNICLRMFREKGYELPQG